MKKPVQFRRHVWQIVFLGASLTWLGATLFTQRVNIHQACPYAVVCFGAMDAGIINTASTVAVWAVIVGLLIVLSTMWLGRRFCAWICPLGSVQEGLFSLRSKSYKIKRKLPFWYDRKFAWIKYFLLGLTTFLAAMTLSWRYMRLCPFVTLARLPGVVWQGAIVLLIILVSSFLVERWWCRFLCPYAALMNLAQKLGQFMGINRSKMKRNLERCNDCGVCVLYCPMNLNLAESEYVQSENCIHCGLCAEVCPKPGTYSEESE
ncbi:MAG TPA: 4Fe-4S binding protein [Candidatus Cloacimonadota bacterium]|nr:4Fe-4S binding protein [Candidatus Cloacimonadota bacterium]